MLGLDHVVFPVRDAAATLGFYRGTLGLPLIACHSGDDWGGHPWLMMIFGLAGGGEIVCVALKGAPAPSYAGLPRDVRHYALRAEDTADFEAWRARILTAGLDHWEEVHGDQRSIYFPDPDGVILEITWPASAFGSGEDAGAVAAAAAWIG